MPQRIVDAEYAVRGEIVPDPYGNPNECKDVQRVETETCVHVETGI